MASRFLSMNRAITQFCAALCSALFVVFGGSASVAQSMPWISPQVLSTTTGTDVMSTVLQDKAASADKSDEEAASRSTNGLTAKGRRNVAQAAAVDFRYRYNPARTAQNMRSFLARAPSRAARAELEQMLAAQPTLMGDIAAGVRAYGFDPHNVADAYAVWWVNVWGASEKRNVEPDAETVSAVKKQVYAAFAAMPGFAATSDAERQEYAEALLLQATMLGSAFEQWKNDPKMLDQLAAAAREGAKASGIDLSLMTLTQNGFVPRS
ncbi:DUF6683 family protein [Sphingomonas sp. FW199]|uniref:DUF6683 family protein n=1 Tax=Sphingomonas sp. FW199 TaxID=3400217 RepID=UPI003CF45FFC